MLSGGRIFAITKESPNPMRATAFFSALFFTINAMTPSPSNIRACLVRALVFPLSAGALFAAKPSPADESSNTYLAKSGAWESAKNWSLKHVPVKGEGAVVYDASVSLSSKVSSISTLNFGGSSNAVLTLREGGVLEVSGKCFIGRKRENTRALLAIEGGCLRVNPDGRSETSKIYVGETATHAGSAGQIKISSGTIAGGILLGSSLPNTGVGTLSLLGGGACVGGSGSLDGITCNYGTIEFVMDEKSVSTLNYPDGNARFEKGSLIRVDGAAYAGPTATFSLLRYRKCFDAGARIVCENFPQKYKVQCGFEKNALVLKIKAD